MPESLPGGGNIFRKGLAEGAMDEDANVPERFRLPTSFGESDDPVDRNPYPPEHQDHRAWLEATRRAQAEVCRISSDAFALSGASSSLTPENADGWLPAMAVAKFDVWAARSLEFVRTDDAVRLYALGLVDYANGWIDSVSEYFASHPPPFPPDRFLADLRSRLGTRVYHWREEALRRLVQHDAHGAAAALQGPTAPSAGVIERRHYLIQKHRNAHGLSAVGFARKVGISDTVIRGIVREDWKRFNRVTQEKLLRALGMTREDWYRE